MAKRGACLLLGLFGLLQSVAATELVSDAPLRCRLGNGPWQPCRMVVQADGLGWELTIGQQRIGFRHDARGSVSMRKGPSPWKSVEARWMGDAALCWDGVCAQGAIPLD